MGSAVIFPAAMLALLAGCAMVDIDDPAYDSFFADHHPGFSPSGNPWIGRSRGDLESELGPPELILEVTPIGTPAYGAPHSVALVYNTDRSGPSGCIDAYVVVESTGLVATYYCR